MTSISPEEPIEPNEIFNSDGTSADPTPPPRPVYWHVYGSPIEGKRAGKKNYVQVTAGPLHKAADKDVTRRTIEGAHGETFKYQGTFDHDPTDEDLLSLRPKAYR